ncbi:MAG TPA: serine hydrolase domain-containing protein [Puia sp.]|nr:serine hydrolase domain-containing protein [Puia sp.]
MKILYLLLYLLAGFVCHAQGQGKDPLTEKLDSFFRLQPGDQPGIALSIEKRGTVLYRRAAGLADKETRVAIDSLSNFRMASLSKQFTAMGILLLEKDQRLSLEDPIRKYLPELPGRIGDRVLIRHLLTHSSGLLDYESLVPSGQSTQLLDADVLHLLAGTDSLYFEPGSRFRYSNSGFCLLALIIERISHESYARYIKEKIFAPLQMAGSVIYEAGHPISHRAMGYAKDSTGLIVPSDQSITSATKGDGGIYTSLADYSKWIRALQENKLLRLSSVLKRLRFPIAGMRESYYGAGWFIIASSPIVLFHSGSTCGFTNFVIQLPGDEWSIVYFSNLADNISPFRQMVRILQEAGIGDFSSVFALYELTR